MSKILLTISFLILFSCSSKEENKQAREIEPQIKFQQTEIQIENPIEVIQRIFTNYNKSQESTDSKANIDSMLLALDQLEKKIDAKDLPLIVDVWMYYTITDIPIRVKTLKVLKAHKQESIVVIKTRMKTQKEWESEDEAPFSELKFLLTQLE